MKKKIISFLFILIFIFSSCFIAPFSVFADDNVVVYTSVFDDLKKDSSFEESDYLEKEDYSN